LKAIYNQSHYDNILTPLSQFIMQLQATQKLWVQDTECILMPWDAEYESCRGVWMHSKMIPLSMPNAVTITEQATVDEV